MAFPLNTTGSLSPTFVPAPPVGVAVMNQIVESALEDYLEPDQQKAAVMVLPPEFAKQFTQPIQTVKASGSGAAGAGLWGNSVNEKRRVKAC